MAEIVKRECRFVWHIRESAKSGRPDAHYIKEQLHYSDGTVKPNIRLVRDYKRPFWVTKESYRNHKSKKEYEDIDKLYEYSSTESKLFMEAANALNVPHLGNQPKQVKESPYLYGVDKTSSSLIKGYYLDKNEGVQSPYTLAVLDIETDIDDRSIYMCTVVFKDQVFTSVRKDYLDRTGRYTERFNEKLNQYLPDHANRFNFELSPAKDEIDVIRQCFDKLHLWMPDFLAIWNIDFDIVRIIERIEKRGIDPRDILCDPKIPRGLRICRYQEGQRKLLTSSGNLKPKHPAQQWHTLYLTASFYVIDAMCTYKHLRLAQPEESSYSLDNILNKELGTRKLKFEEANDYKGAEWHKFMVDRYPIEYIVYNIYDCIGIIDLDLKTKDLSSKLPSFSASSEFKKFSSNPKKIVDAFYYFTLGEGKVVGCVGSAPMVESEEIEVEEEDSDAVGETLGLKGWIVTLRAHYLAEDGLAVIEELPNVRTNARAYVFDADETSAYPNSILVGNVSRETTSTEVIDIEGIDLETFKMQNINILSGKTNSLEYCVNMFSLPTPKHLLRLLE